MPQKPTCILWFRQDLRLHDHPALTNALENYKHIIPLFICNDQDKWAPGEASKWWLHHSLNSLSKDLEKKGSRLILRKGSPLVVLQNLVQETGAQSVYWSRCYEPMSMSSDAKITSTLHNQNITATSFPGNVLFEPWTIANKQGKPYTVFTPFWKTCLQVNSIGRPLPEPKIIPSVSASLYSETLESFKLLPTILWDKGFYEQWKPGASKGKSLLSAFIQNNIKNYKKTRDRPDWQGTSQFSPYLHFGEISVREIWHQAQHSFGMKDEGTECFLRELGWREFAHHLLYHFPKTVENPLKEQFNAMTWKHDPKALLKWQKGNTGYPIVDAGMRQLWKIGWMHNRVRMIVGSFLVKDLRIHWLEGAKWFWDTLVDADLANNTLGWQWVAGCGADAAPYFRIFNPVSQGEKFDPEGNYVREWIPELRKMPTEWIHRPWAAPDEILEKAKVKLGKDYPLPIVDHKIAREESLADFAKIKKE